MANSGDPDESVIPDPSDPDVSGGQGPPRARRRLGWLIPAVPVVALAFALGAAVFGGGQGDHRVAVMIPGSVRFFDVQLEAMHQHAGELGLEVVAFNAGWSPQVQLDQIAVALAQDFAVVAVAAADTSVVSQATKLNSSGPPLLIFTNAITEQPGEIVAGTAGYVGRDEYVAGQLLGQQAIALAEELDIGAPKVLLIAGAPGTAPQTQRTSGYLAEVADLDRWPDPVEVPIPGWDLAHVEAELARLLRNNQFDLIATQWADAAVVASRFVEREGLDVPIVSLEWTEDLARAIASGHIRSSTHFSVPDEGRAVVEAAARLIDGEPGPLLVEIEQRIVKSDQADGIDADW